MDHGAQIAKGDFCERFVVNHEKAVEVIGEIGQFEPNGFVNTPANAIATNGGLEDFFRNNDAEALMMPLIRSVDQGNRGRANGLTSLVSMAYAAARMKTVFAR